MTGCCPNCEWHGYVFGGRGTRVRDHRCPECGTGLVGPPRKPRGMTDRRWFELRREHGAYTNALREAAKQERLRGYQEADRGV